MPKIKSSKDIPWARIFDKICLVIADELDIHTWSDLMQAYPIIVCGLFARLVDQYAKDKNQKN
jgi:hypothetical protein